jgi:hypothetical protein
VSLDVGIHVVVVVAAEHSRVDSGDGIHGARSQLLHRKSSHRERGFEEHARTSGRAGGSGQLLEKGSVSEPGRLDVARVFESYAPHESPRVYESGRICIESIWCSSETGVISHLAV